MGSSSYCLDMDYLLVCIVSRQSRVSVPYLKKKKNKNNKKLALKNFSFMCAWHVMFGETSFIKSIFRVIPYKLT